jgi:hypothetical protein
LTFLHEHFVAAVAVVIVYLYSLLQAMSAALLFRGNGCWNIPCAILGIAVHTTCVTAYVIPFGLMGMRMGLVH